MKRLVNRPDFFYIIGAFLSLIYVINSIIFYNNYGYTLFFSLSCFGAYLGVVLRGVIDENSWGKTSKQIKISYYVGLFSIFVISLIYFILLYNSFSK